MIFVLDASAMIAFLRDESGADVVSEVLFDPASKCHAHVLNLCEVFYDFHRAANRDVAAQAIADLLSLGISEEATITAGVWQEAGALKARFRRVSLADCFAIELARRLGAAILTSDHHESDALVSEPLCRIRFIR